MPSHDAFARDALGACKAAHS